MSVIKFRKNGSKKSWEFRDKKREALTEALGGFLNNYFKPEGIPVRDVVNAIMNVLVSFDIQHAVEEDCETMHCLEMISDNLETMCIGINKTVAHHRKQKENSSDSD